MNRNFSFFKSVFNLYILWALVLMARAFWYRYTIDYDNEIVNEAYQYSFLIFNIAGIATISVGAVLAWYAQKRKVWAIRLFILFCALYAIDALLLTFQVMDIYKQANQFSLFKGPIAAIAWSILAVHAVFPRPYKALKTDAPKSGAPLS